MKKTLAYAIIRTRKVLGLRTMSKILTDMHSHSSFSHDCKIDFAKMLACAQEKGLSFYGLSDHFDYDYDILLTEIGERPRSKEETEEYFHKVRHLQEDYEGVMNVAIGAEFGFSEAPEVQDIYQGIYDKFRPDFVINSVHSGGGVDFYRHKYTESKEVVYRKYLRLIRKSLDTSYPYDIVGHIGYIARYVPYEDKSFSLEEFGEELDDIFLTVIKKDKILEVNSKSKGLPQLSLPNEALLRRYYELGGRKISFGSDAHIKEHIAFNREEVVKMLKGIGFTYITVPFRGEYIKVEI